MPITLSATEDNPYVEKILTTVREIPFDEQMVALHKAIAWLNLVHCANYISFNRPHRIGLDVNGASLAFRDSADTSAPLEEQTPGVQAVHTAS